MKDGPHTADFGRTFPCWITMVVKTCFLCNLSLSGLIFCCQAFFFFFINYYFHILFQFLCFIFLSFQKSLNCKIQLWTQISAPYIQIRNPRWFLFPAPWWKGIKPLSCIWVWFILQYCHHCFLENMTSLLTASSSSLRLKGQRQKRPCCIFYCVVIHTVVAHVFVTSASVLNLPEFETTKPAESCRAAVILFCICHLLYPWKRKEHEHG